MRTPVAAVSVGKNSLTIIMDDGSVVVRSPVRGKTREDQFDIDVRIMNGQPVAWEWREGEPIPGTQAAEDASLERSQANTTQQT